MPLRTLSAPSSLRRPLHSLTLLLLTSLLFGGCSLHKMTGDMLSEYAVEHLNPFMLAFGDTQMACELAQSLGGQMLSYERVTDRPNKAGVVVMASAGICTEQQAWAEELRSLRAIKRADAAGAQDARIEEKRLHLLAAQRFQLAFDYMEAQFGAVSDKCPKFKDQSDELTWLLGSIALVQAVQHDRAAEGRAGVPLDKPRAVARGIRCLDNARWWGLPAALQAAIWTGIPGAAPEGEDPWVQLEAAAQLAEKSGVRLALAVRAQAAAAAGREDLMRDSVRRLAASMKQTPSPKAWRTLDGNAFTQAQALSDRLWTEATGHRTPLGELGSFWDDETSAAGAEDDTFFDDIDDLGDEEGGAPSPAQTPQTPAEADDAGDTQPTGESAP